MKIYPLLDYFFTNVLKNLLRVLFESISQKLKSMAMLATRNEKLAILLYMVHNCVIISENNFNYLVILYIFSISMRTVDSLGTSVTTDSSLYGSLIDSQTASSYSAGGEEQVSSTTSTAHTASGDFEEYIDLNVNNRNTIINNSEDLLNFNSIDNKLDNITTGEDSHPMPPIIAFEDNATRRQEVTGNEKLPICISRGHH